MLVEVESGGGKALALYRDIPFNIVLADRLEMVFLGEKPCPIAMFEPTERGRLCGRASARALADSEAWR